MSDGRSAALYMRLSKEDEGGSESASIAMQRKMLRAYAAENGFLIAGEYIDDGWSGTSFDRPSFKRMIADIEAKGIDIVITKDLSRLGRNYITAGQYTEQYFPEHNVRYIAVNDGYDSEGAQSDLLPFKNIINEMYARDISKKIRSAFQTKMKEGSYIGNFAPYGYRRDPLDKHKLLIDCEAAEVVREIFRMSSMGARPSEIANHLNRNAVASPIVHRCKTHPTLDPNAYIGRKEWGSSTICKILSNIIYLGHMAQGKTSKPSLKSGRVVRHPYEKWYIVENTHEPIINPNVFDIVRKRCVSRRTVPVGSFQNVFSGVAKCSDCGSNMSTTASGSKGSTYNLVCGRYKLRGSKECSNHFISYDLLYQSVFGAVRRVLTLSEREKRYLIEELIKARQSTGAQEKTSELRRQIKTLEYRDREIDILFRRLYEDNAVGRITQVRFDKLSASYEAEQSEIGKKIRLLKKAISRDNTFNSSTEGYFKLLENLSDPKELTSELIKELIDKIEIGQGIYEKTERGKEKRQTVRIFWRFTDETD